MGVARTEEVVSWTEAGQLCKRELFVKAVIDICVLRQDATIEATIEAAASAGFECLELAISNEGPLSFDTPQERCADISKQLRDAGLSLSGLAIEDPTGTDFGVTKEGPREAALGRVVAALDRVAWLDADVLTFAPGIVGLSGAQKYQARYEDVYASSLDALLVLRFEAEHRAVRIACQCGVNRFLLSPMETREFFDGINSPSVGACLDINAVRLYGFADDWLLTLGYRASRVRLGPAVAPWPAGLDSTAPDGNDPRACIANADWQGIAAALRKIGYQGPLTCVGMADPKEAKESLAELLQSFDDDAECA